MGAPIYRASVKMLNKMYNNDIYLFSSLLAIFKVRSGPMTVPVAKTHPAKALVAS